MNSESIQRAAVLVEALPYIQRFNKEIVVVRYGDGTMLDGELKKKVIQDVVFLKLVGFRSIIIRGKGKETSKWVNKTDMEAQLTNGLRVIGEPTMEIVEMVPNKVDKGLVQLVNELGIKVVGISGKGGMMLKCHREYSGGRDIRYAGGVEKVDPKIICDLPKKDFLPIICPIGSDDEFLNYNANVDGVACAIATAVQAEKLTFLTDVGGVHKGSDDRESLISGMTMQEAQGFVSSGMLGGGMLSKLQDRINAITDGVSRVRILDGYTPHCLLLEILADWGIGAAIFNSEEDERHYYG